MEDLKVKLSKAVYDDSLAPWATKKEVEFPQIEDVY